MVKSFVFVIDIGLRLGLGLGLVFGVVTESICVHDFVIGLESEPVLVLERSCLAHLRPDLVHL